MPTTKATSEDFEVAASHGSWALNAATADHVFAAAGATVNYSTSGTGYVLTSNIQLDDAACGNLVLPQTGTVKVVVPAVIKQNGIVLFDDDMEFDLDVDWKEGYRYIYTLVLNDDTDLLWAINFTATVDNIRNGGTDDIRVPDGTKLN